MYEALNGCSARRSFPMETLAELQAMLKRIEKKWENWDLGSPSGIVAIDRERRELRKRIGAFRT
jgi:hypothetical protein